MNNMTQLSMITLFTVAACNRVADMAPEGSMVNTAAFMVSVVAAGVAIASVVQRVRTTK